MLYHFRKIASLFRALFKVLLNLKIIFCCLNFSNDVFRAYTICYRRVLGSLGTFQILWFFCCHFVIVVLQKDVMLVKADANVTFSRLISHKFNGFNAVVL